MLDFKKKYLKYKQKYVSLKKIIGGGIPATYIKTNKQLTLTYTTHEIKYTTTHIIKYTILKQIGEGTYGQVYLIENNDNKKQYILKEGKKHSSTVSNDEGLKSDLLKGILADDMLVLFQGTDESDFLISTYNGNDLYQEFKDKKQEIKEKYAIITIQLLDLLHTINKNNIFHNDIKLANITIKNDNVYLIDFGLLTKSKSNMGSLISMSYNGVIAILKTYNNTFYSQTYSELQTILQDTDIIGFFYCCIDLLFLTVDHKFNSYNILSSLQISSFNKTELYNLFKLFYFILPESKRNISKLNSTLPFYEDLLPSKDRAISIFGTILDENINLFRFMAYIYYNIKNRLIKNETQDIWYKNFLKIMSACFLPNFNYDQFKPQFNAIVSGFLDLSDNNIPYSVSGSSSVPILGSDSGSIPVLDSDSNSGSGSGTSYRPPPRPYTI